MYQYVHVCKEKEKIRTTLVCIDNNKWKKEEEQKAKGLKLIDTYCFSWWLHLKPPTSRHPS